MSKLIAHEYMKELIYHDMAQKNIPAEGLEILSLNRVLNEEERVSDAVLILKLAKRLKANAAAYSEYEKMFSFPSFYEEVISFAKQLALWNLDADNLPAEGENERQLRAIVKEALRLELPEKITAAHLEESVQKALSEKIKAVQGFENSYFQYTVLKKMREAGMEMIDYADAKPAETLRRHALSTRTEIESCAQYICRNSRPCNVVLCSPADQMPVLKQVFERYGIPFSYTAQKKNVAIGAVYETLVQFAVYRDRDHLLDAFAAQAFPYRCDDDLLDFLDQVLTGISAPAHAEEYKAAYERAQSEKYDPEKALKRDPVSVYTKLEERASAYFAKIEGSIDSLSTAENPKEKLIRAYNVLTRSPLIANSDEMAAGRSLLAALQDCIDLIESDEDALFFARMSRDTGVSSHKLVTDFCTVTDLSHPVLPAENTYVLGCSGKSYPGFASMSGVFDETYAARVKGFPSLDERQKAYLKQLEWIEHSCNGELIYSYATNDYQGREQIFAFELEGIGESQRWELDYYDEKRSYDHELSKESAKDLFLRTDETGNPYISGSISSVESWFRCPYRYFLASGLYVRKPQKPDLSADSVGTWQHAAMEKAVYNENGMIDPDYAEHLNAERIAGLIRPYFDALRIANPNDTARICLSEKRMISSLLKAAQFLKEYERSSTFIPNETERTFRRFAVSDHVRLNGTIDRISKDGANHMFEVIDYKSSSKTLSPASVKAGQQLQLLTYLCAAAELYGLEEDISPAGTYYFSLSADNITDAKKTAALSVNRNGFKLSERNLRTDDKQMKTLMIASRRLNGWTFTDRTDAIDGEGSYVNGLKNHYSYDSVRECLETLYEYFYENLTGENTEGKPDISVNPVEKACEYCDYKGICRYHGDGRKAQEIYQGKLTEERIKAE